MKVNRTLPRRVVKLLQVLNISVQTVTMLGGYQQFDNGTFYRSVRPRGPKGAYIASINDTATMTTPWSKRQEREEARVLRWHRREANNSQANLIIASGMLCMVLMVVVIVFYFSQRSIRKRGGTVYQQQRGWLESDGVLDVYTVDQAGQPLNDDAANGYVPSPVRANTHQHRTPVHRPHTHQPPPSYESAVATSLLMDPNANTASPAHTPTMPPSPAVPPMLTSHMMSSIGAQLLFQRQQLVHRSDHHHASPSVHTTRNCCCQQRMRLIERQDYDIIKKCRQCRKQIRPDNEADDDEASNDGEWPTEDYCECLLRNHVTVAAYALGIDDGAEVDRKREERAQQQPPPPQSKLGKLIRATDTERAATATSAAATSSTSLAEQAPSASDVWAHPSMRSRNTEDIADDDDDEDEDGGNDDDDLHARLVSDKLDGATSLDTSGLPSYDAAAKLRPMCDELN